MINDPAFYRRPGGTVGMKLLQDGRFIVKNQDGICPNCNTNRIGTYRKRGQVFYKKWCHYCLDLSYGSQAAREERMRRHNENRGKKHRASKLNPCCKCGFVPVDGCQMDIDHIDGDRTNNNPENKQLLCANCHRLKTQVNRDCYSKRYKQVT